MSKDKIQKEKEEKPTPETLEARANVIPDPADKALCAWFAKLFDGGWPEKIELVQLNGTRANRRGIVVETHAMTKTSQMFTHEVCVQMTNKWIEAAQRNCNGVGIPMRYGALATSSASAPAPYTSYIFALVPKKEIGVDGGEFDPSHDPATFLDENQDPTGNDKMLGRFQQWGVDDRWRVEQYHATMGGMLQLQHSIILRQQDHIEKLTNRNLQAAEDMFAWKVKAFEQEVAASWQALKVETVREGIGMVKGFLPFVVNGVRRLNPEDKAKHISRTLKTFIESCNESQLEAAFGTWKAEPDGSIRVRAKQGFFTEEQCHTLDALAEGKVKPDEVTATVSKLRDSFQPNQINQAQTTFEMKQIAPVLALLKNNES